MSAYRGTWLTGTVYIIGDSVSDSTGYYWNCLAGHTSSVSIVLPSFPTRTNSYWQLSDRLPDAKLAESTLPAYVELFKVDCTSIPNNANVFYITPNLAADGVSKVIFGGQTYEPYPIALSGLAQNSDGAYPRPRLDVANIYGATITGVNIFNNLVKIYQDLIGTQVTYTRTFSIYLNLTSSISAAPLKFYIAKKLNHDNVGISFELRSALDKERAYLPARQMLKRDFPGLGINKAIR